MTLARRACLKAAVATTLSGALGGPCRMPALAAGRHGHGVFEDAHSDPSAARLRERSALLRQGEAALARLDTDAAQLVLDKAAMIAHAADTELMLVRCHMQAGEYRRALAFCAHTAGAHLDEAQGAALYAWLLHIGGQGVIAQKLLAETASRAPRSAAVTEVARQLKSRLPLATGILLQPPARFAPYASEAGVPMRARNIGSAVLGPDGRSALVPGQTLQNNAGRLWVRNGLGLTVRAHVVQGMAASELTVLRLDRVMPTDSTLQVSARDAFPGSVGLAVEFIAGSDAAPAWPVLTGGFIGAPLDASGGRHLGIELRPGPRGGPVFDTAGRLVGIAATRSGHDRLLPSSVIRSALPDASLPQESTAPESALPMSLIYESAMRRTLQVISAAH